MKKKILCTMMSMVMVASLFAGGGTDSGTENSASDNSKTEETGQTTSDVHMQLMLEQQSV